jgi:hypothetical protein
MISVNLREYIQCNSSHSFSETDSYLLINKSDKALNRIENNPRFFFDTLSKVLSFYHTIKVK